MAEKGIPMKAVCKTTGPDGKVRFDLVERERPQPPGPGEVGIRITHIGICTSDIHALHGAMQVPDGNIVGHEFSGIVEQLGAGVTTVGLGDRVVCELAKGACMKCPVCIGGHYEFCPVKTPPGWASSGIYTEYTIQPQHCLHRIAETVPPDVAALAEPLAICVYGCLERARMRPHERTVVYGMGPIGLSTLIILKDAGFTDVVCVTSTRHGRERLELAAALGADASWAAEDDIPALAASRWQGGPDVVVDCSGAVPAIQQGIALLPKGGRLVALGITGRPVIDFPFDRALLRALEVIFSCTSSHSSWQHVCGVLERRHADVARMIDMRLPLDRWQEAYRSLEERRAIKAVLMP